MAITPIVLPTVEESIAERLSEAIFLIEATSYEQLSLWREHSHESDTVLDRDLTWWEQVNPGHGFKVGELAGMPVVISLSYNRINDKLVAFWEPTSQVVDYRIIAKWFEDNFHGTWDNGRRRATTNAMNFGHVVEETRK